MRQFCSEMASFRGVPSCRWQEDGAVPDLPQMGGWPFPVVPIRYVLRYLRVVVSM